jgi:hypothetical protein
MVGRNSSIGDTENAALSAYPPEHLKARSKATLLLRGLVPIAFPGHITCRHCYQHCGRQMVVAGRGLLVGRRLERRVFYRSEPRQSQ